nr:NTP transferase domain-containing protein [Desulfobulbaceae bacterium]
MQAMVLAAGLGTRLRPFTSVRPKPLFPVMGEPLILRIIRSLRRSGFTRIVVNAYHLKEQLIALLDSEPDIILQLEPIELGTGGGLRMALESLAPGPVLVTNADIYHDIDYRWAYESHRGSGAGATLVMHNCPRFNKVLVSEQGNIISFQSEMIPEPAMKIRAFTGIHVLETALLNLIPQGQFYSVIDAYTAFISQGGIIKALEADNCFWRDIGTPADYLELHRDFVTGSSQEIQKDQRRDGFQFGSDTRLERNVTLKEWGYIGANVTIGVGSHLERVVVWDGAKIPPGTIAKDTIVV